MKYVCIVIACCLFGTVVFAGENQPVDSTDNKPVTDSTATPDTIPAPQSVTDSLTDIQRAKLLFEKKLAQHQEEIKQHIFGLSFFDTLVTYFTSERLNKRQDIDMSFFHDAGDYFRSVPSYVTLEHQVTPMRKTIQPFGLAGNRLGVLADGFRLQPFEHIPEPDGMIDMNDIPTALDNDIFIIPGAAGQIFGGPSSVATLLTRPKRPEDFRAESAILADKGGFAYNHVRGRYAKRFRNGRDFNMLIEYRNADGPDFFRESDNYHYYGNFIFPLGGNSGVHVWGQLNNRNGPLVVRPEAGGSYVLRNKFDRAARIAYTKENNSRTSHTEVGYKHRRQGSSLTGILDGRYNLTGNGGFFLYQWQQGHTLFATRIESEYLEYDNGYHTFNRYHGNILMQVGNIDEGLRWAGSFGGRYVERYGFLPNAALMLFRETSSSLLLISTGYSSRAPELHEMYLPHQRSAIYGSSGLPYVEEGNSQLASERQLIGNIVYELGTVANNIAFSITGGKIFDGIDWKYQTVTDSLGNSVLFSPENGDISFYDITIQPRIKIQDFLTYVGGGAYHHVEYTQIPNRAYTPEYQIFSGAELHLYWRQKLMDLFAYGEITYVGPYHGYSGQELGKDVIANVKLSFAIKDYRMHFVFQNALGRAYRSREYLTFPGRYFYYGFTWQFLD